MKALLYLFLFSVPVFAADAGAPVASQRAKQAAKLIQGQCQIVQSEKNPFAGPCSNVSLILQTKDGKEFLRTRTDPDGSFGFGFDDAGDYTVNSGTKFYELALPAKTLHGGETVLLFLRRK